MKDTDENLDNIVWKNPRGGSAHHVWFFVYPEVRLFFNNYFSPWWDD